MENMFQYLHHHPRMGELFTFLIALSESLPFIGTIIPGSVTMTAIGTLVGTGILPGFITFFWATVGAFCGDCIGFWFGKHYKEKIPKIWPFHKYPNWLKFGENFFNRHGGKSILIGRFVGPARSTVPLVAGLLNFSWGRFLTVAIPSAIFWAIVYLTPGVILGAVALELPPGKMTEVILIGLLIIVLLWFLFWLIQRSFQQLAKFVNHRVDNLWNSLNRQHSSRYFINFITNQQNPNDHHQLTLTLLSVCSLLLFIILFILVATQDFILHINQPLFHFLQSLRFPKLDAVMIYITMMANPIVILIAGTIVAICLSLTRNWRAAIHFIGLLIFTALTIGFCKQIYHSPRPTGFMQIASSSSFPSGHTLMGFVFFGFLAFLTNNILEKKWHWLVYTVISLLIVCIGLSRLYLGAHWLFDIIGSLLLGSAILFAVIMNYRRMPRAAAKITISSITWLIILAITLTVPWLGFSYKKYHQARYRYTPYSLQFKVSRQQWWNSPNEYLPIFRNNRFGNPSEPFNIQWAAHLNTIEQTLKKSGWRLFNKETLIKSALQRFSGPKPEYHMPLLPLLYLDQPPVLMMIKHLPDKKSIIEIRLWRTNVSFTDSKIPIWIGSLDLHLPPHKLINFYKKPEITFSSKKIFSVLQSDLINFLTKIITIPLDIQSEKMQQLHWDGKILIIF